MSFVAENDAKAIHIKTEWGRYRRIKSETQFNSKTGTEANGWKREPFPGEPLKDHAVAKSIAEHFLELIRRGVLSIRKRKPPNIRFSYIFDSMCLLAALLPWPEPGARKSHINCATQFVVTPKKTTALCEISWRKTTAGPFEKFELGTKRIGVGFMIFVQAAKIKTSGNVGTTPTSFYPFSLPPLEKSG